MAISPIIVPQIPAGHPNLLNTDFDRTSDQCFRLCGRPVEMYRFVGDGSTTVKADFQTGFDRVIGGLVFNMTDGTNWPIATTVVVDADDPSKVDIAGIPADTDAYLLILFGEKTVAESVGVINAITPSVPTGLHVVSDTTTTVTLAWDASQHPYLSVTGYQHRVDGGSAVDDGDVLTVVATGLTTATEYDFEVRAYVTDSFGNTVYSDWSAVVTETTD